MRIIISVLLAAVLYGCAGTNFSFDKARQVEVGMTEAQVQQLLGRPYTVVSRGGSQLWVWSHGNAFGGSRSVSFEMQNGQVVSVPEIPSSFK
ncbi:outer membrane protein assembly factor BamE domain-containing protein [Phytopseudomonas daroniae]|uniref:outer membrane protein assembly factor BamE domain-containing protein n=1 Tax=Phytopseudomonas daroniae TaxID=2487519 RepID=UPI0010384C7B|nr:outer membrane protein assembly factor BamE [Pseudomonas daroniae]TBU75196.1 hypothetical protein DNK10_11100 [Pseudomonas daroniae]